MVTQDALSTSRRPGWRRRRAGWLACLCFAAPAAAFPAPAPEAIPITGNLLDEAGSPLEGVEMTLHPLPGERESMALRLAAQMHPGAVEGTTTDQEGRFRLDAPAPGFWTVVARAEGRAALEYPLSPLLPLPPGAAFAPGREIAPVRLPPATWLEIQVVGEGGGGEGGVLVEVASSADENGGRRRFSGEWRPVRILTLTDRAGRARASVYAAGKVSVRASAGAREGRLEIDEVPGASPVRVPLGRQPARDARVARPDGRPAADVLTWTIWGPLGRTDAEGRIEVPVLERHSHRLHVASDDGLAASVMVQPRSEAPEPPLYLTLQPPLEASGRVIERDQRRPVPGALVWVSGEPGKAVRGGPDGAFRLRIPSMSAYSELRAAAPGFAIVRRPLEREGGAVGSGLVLELEPAAWIGGRVLDAAGPPLAGARLAALPSSGHQAGGGPPVPTAWSGPDGGFLLEGLDPAYPYEIRAVMEGYATAVVELPPPSRGEDGRPVPRPALRLVAGEPRTLIGRVVDEAGDSIRGAEVTLVSEDLAGDRNLWVAIPSFTKATEAHGRFEFENPAPVASLLAVVAPGYAPLFRRGLELSPDSAVTDLGELTVEPEAFVQGRVVDEEGSPVESAEVREGIASSPSFVRDLLFRHREPDPRVVTGPDGSFVLARLIPGEPVLVKASKAGFAPAEVWAHASRGGEPVEVELRVVARISGRVTDAAGRPVARAGVSPADVGGDGGDFRWVATDEEGRFEIAEAPPGRVYLKAEASGHARSEPVALDLAPGERRSGVELVLREGFVLTGRLIEPAGGPVQGVRVWARPGSRAATTDAQGRFSIEDLPRGPVQLDIDRDGFLLLVREIDFEPASGPVELRLPTAEVEGMFLGRDGAPAPGRELQLLERGSGVLSSSARQVVTAADGSFRFRGVAGGTYRLKLFGAELSPFGWLHPEPILVEEGHSVTGIEVRDPPTFTASGRLLGLALEALGAAEILATNQESGFHGVRPGEVLEDGRFTIDGLYPGRWYVVTRIGQVGYVGARAIEVAGEDVAMDVELVECPEESAGETLEERCSTDPDAP